MPGLRVLSWPPGIVRRGGLNGSPFAVPGSLFRIVGSGAPIDPVGLLVLRRLESEHVTDALKFRPLKRGTLQDSTVNGEQRTANRERFRREFLLNGPFYCAKHGV